MSRTSRAVVALLIICAAVSPAASAVFIFTGTLSGDQERPTPVLVTEGTGNVVVTWDEVAHTMHIEANFADLLGQTTAAHIHTFVPPAEAGGVATMLPSFTGFPLGVTSGTFDMTFDLTDPASFNPAFITNFGGGTVAGAEAALLAALLEGRGYFNVHTHEFPAGEIRANLTAIPEPATWMLMLGGFAAVGLTFRRRRTMRSVAA